VVRGGGESESHYFHFFFAAFRRRLLITPLICRLSVYIFFHVTITPLFAIAMALLPLMLITLHTFFTLLADAFACFFMLFRRYALCHAMPLLATVITNAAYARHAVCFAITARVRQRYMLRAAMLMLL